MVQYLPYSKSEIEEMQRAGEGTISGEKVVTGFDILLEQKAKNIEIVRQLKLKNPRITRREISAITGLSLRTITRHMQVIIKAYKKGFVKNHVEILIEERKQRVQRLKQLIFKHPDWSNERLGRNLGVSARRVMVYKKELRK